MAALHTAGWTRLNVDALQQEKVPPPRGHNIAQPVEKRT